MSLTTCWNLLQRSLILEKGAPLLIIYINGVIVPYTIKAYSLEHKKRYNIVINKEKIINVLQQVPRDFLLRV